MSTARRRVRGPQRELVAFGRCDPQNLAANPFRPASVTLDFHLSTERIYHAALGARLRFQLDRHHLATAKGGLHQEPSSREKLNTPT